MSETPERVAFWRGHWEAWAASGISQRAYCARHGLSYAAFGYWRNRVKVRVTPPAPAFVPVLIEPAPGATADPAPGLSPTPLHAGPGVEIRLAHGRTIVVAAAFDDAVLARVIRVLEQLPC